MTNPDKQSKKEYFQLSRKFNARGLKGKDYKTLCGYWNNYEKIKDHRTYNENLIKLKQKKIE